MVIRRAPTGLATLSFLLIWAVPSQAQVSPALDEVGPSGTVDVRGTGVASRTEVAPILDGSLDEPAWQQAAPFGGFTQAEPLAGQLASEDTEVRILYDDEFIYVGVINYDSRPDQLLVTDSRRDANLSDTDSFQMIFDTYLDRQNGFMFGTNPAGTQYDAQVRNEGQGGGGGGGGGGGAAFGGNAQRGSGGGTNTNWDSNWDVRVSITDIGWIAEFRIPLRTFRYGPPPQRWGVNFLRNLPRNRERAYWSPVAQQFDLSRLSSAGDLEGLELRTPRNFTVTPYAVSSAERDYTLDSDTDLDGDVGFDAKFGVTPSLNLDLTVNTDFAQVEVDEQQINLTRFNLRFPEKRPFFLENAGLFAVGTGGVDLFFSRSIGISESGSLVPIRGGARMSGRMGGLNVGALNIQTGGVQSTPANNYSALRVSREFPNRSSLGVVAVSRMATGGGTSNDWNRTWGLDGRLGIGEGLTFTSYGARTETPGFSEDQYAYSGGVAYEDPRHSANFDYGRVGENFNPEVGFLPRRGGYERLAGRVGMQLRDEGLRAMGFRELNPHVSYQRYNRLDGSLQTARLHMDNHLDWENGNYIAPAVNVDWEGLDQPFEVSPGVVVPAGTYRSTHTAFRTHTDSRKWISATFDWDYGGFLSGHQNSTAPGIILRRGGTMSLAARWLRNDIELPEGSFVTNLANLRATYNFSPLVLVQALVQYNDRTSRWSSNVRFSWLRTAGTGLYIVYNDTEAFDGLGPVNRSLVIKYSHQFDVLR